MDEFNNVVLQVVVIALILLLVIIGMYLHFSKDHILFPPYTTDCPDGFFINSEGNCQINTNYYTNNNYPANFDATAQSSLSMYADGSGDSNNCPKITPNDWADYSDKEKFCYKYNLVQKCDDIFWDGITNSKSNILAQCSDILENIDD